jgi:hypothetical protein
MADDYKEKFRKYIADIPMPPGQITSGPPMPPPYDPDTQKKLEQSTLQVATDKLFLRYTKMTHLELLQNWSNGGIETSCNAFVQHCGYAMGAKDKLGQFELEKVLHKSGNGRAWVPADSGKRPDYGDIFCKHDQLHMGISLGFDGDNWLTVEAGQGGRKMGCDVIRRKSQPFKPAELLGWCDMSVYFNPRGPVPDWLIGMWTIYYGQATYNYYFNSDYECFHYPWKTLGGPEKTVAEDSGTVEFQGSDSFTVTWRKEGGVERFTYDRFNSFPGILEKMTGSSSRREDLKGIRA